MLEAAVLQAEKMPRVTLIPAIPSEKPRAKTRCRRAGTRDRGQTRRRPRPAGPPARRGRSRGTREDMRRLLLVADLGEDDAHRVAAAVLDAVGAGETSMCLSVSCLLMMNPVRSRCRFRRPARRASWDRRGRGRRGRGHSRPWPSPEVARRAHPPCFPLGRPIFRRVHRGRARLKVFGRPDGAEAEVSSYTRLA